MHITYENVETSRNKLVLGIINFVISLSTTLILFFQDVEDEEDEDEYHLNHEIAKWLWFIWTLVMLVPIYLLWSIYVQNKGLLHRNHKKL